MRKVWHTGTVVGALALMLAAAACGGSGDDGGGSATDITGSLNISGSSTVEPITSLVAEKFIEQPRRRPAVDGPGTSDGFELFCNGETDINDASRQSSRRR